MGKRDYEYEVCDMVELDEGFFSTEILDDEKDKPLKRGKESQKKSKVLVMAQTEEGTPSKKSDKPTSVKYIKMFIIEDLKSETIDEKVKMHIDPDSTIKSDDSKSYTNFSTIVKEHIHQVIEPKQVGKVLSWVHIAIANAKRLLLDVYHDIRPECLQNYLNEFCWKFNRRNFGKALFDRLMVAAVSYKNQFSITLSNHFYLSNIIFPAQGRLYLFLKISMRPTPCIFMNPHKRTHNNRPWSHINVLPHPDVVIPEPVPTTTHFLTIALLVMLA